MLKKAKKDTLIFFLISGGGSAMFDLPLDPQITLDDTIAFHQLLLASGAPINEINTLRKHFSAVKGGRLAMAAPEAAKVSLLLPDVPLRSLDALSSGPTSPDHSTVADVRELLAKYDLAPKLPPSIRAFFEREDLPESPGNKGWRPPFFPKLPWAEAAPARRVTAAAINERRGRGLSRFGLRDSALQPRPGGERARPGARRPATTPWSTTVATTGTTPTRRATCWSASTPCAPTHPRLCLISVGEVTVTMDRTPGAGGRNQQFAMACALELEKYQGERLTVLSAGSDGIDGNTQSAGAIADPTTVARAHAFGFHLKSSLAAFNACPMFTALGDAVVTGPTGQNLRDLRLLIAERD